MFFVGVGALFLGELAGLGVWAIVQAFRETRDQKAEKDRIKQEMLGRMFADLPGVPDSNEETPPKG